MRSAARAMAAGAAVLALQAGLWACGSGGGGGTAGSAAAPDMEGVVYAGTANDEALYALLTAKVTADAAQAAVFDVPAEGAALPEDTPATFQWHVAGASAAVSPKGAVWAALGSLVGEREALAHGAPVNGRAYLVVFSTPGDDKLLRVFTTDLSYTPDATAWAALTSAKGTISATVTNALFEEGRITQGGGPFQGKTVTFSITP